MSSQNKLTVRGKSSLRIIFRYGTGLIRACYQSSRFDIKRGYIHRNKVIAHDDRVYTDEFQKEVYQKAAQWMHAHKLTSVIDIGCGSGFKLVKYLGEFSTLGVDLEPAISHAASTYPQTQWLNALQFIPSEHSSDLILCADTIEHVAEPDAFMQSIISIKNWEYLIMSTPERNIKRKWYHYGPPPNQSHYREWSEVEFLKFISRYCEIIHHEVMNYTQGTQMVICRPINN